MKDLRVAALCSLAFAGFFRYNKLCNIVPSHIEFHSECIRTFVPRSKTDVYREGNYVYIRSLGTLYCPIGVLRRYMNLAGIDANSNLPLFRPLVFHMSNTSYTLRDGKISYTSCREILRGTLERRSRNHLSYANCRNHEVCDVYLIYECLLNYPVQDSEIPN